MSTAPARTEQHIQVRPKPPAPPPSRPPLEQGDRLTRPEFERRYAPMNQVKKAEFIEGGVFLPSPVRFYRHGHPHIHITAWLARYEAMTPGVIAADNATARLDLDNEPQPDAMLMIDQAKGGPRTRGICRADWRLNGKWNRNARNHL